MKKKLCFILLFALTSIAMTAQVGDYRNVFSIGVNGGYALNSITFQPKVVQKMHGGMTGGITFRYTSEKYFSTLCAIQMEANIAQLGWKEDILTRDGEHVINPQTGIAEEYTRNQTYIQIPIFAHLSWGKERKGINAFVNLGPQIGFNLSENTKCNYDSPYTTGESDNVRVNTVVEQETMPIENKFDYGIAAGAGIELHLNHIGRLNIEGRYYYGLGNIYGDSKRDYFGTSNHNTIFIKLTYLYDL